MKFIVSSHFLEFLLCNQLWTVGLIICLPYYNTGQCLTDWQGVSAIVLHHKSEILSLITLSPICERAQISHKTRDPANVIVIGKMIIIVRIIVDMNRDLSVNESQ